MYVIHFTIHTTINLTHLYQQRFINIFYYLRNLIDVTETHSFNKKTQHTFKGFHLNNLNQSINQIV